MQPVTLHCVLWGAQMRSSRSCRDRLSQKPAFTTDRDFLKWLGNRELAVTLGSCALGVIVLTIAERPISLFVVVISLCLGCIYAVSKVFPYWTRLNKAATRNPLGEFLLCAALPATSIIAWGFKDNAIYVQIILAVAGGVTFVPMHVLRTGVPFALTYGTRASPTVIAN